MYDLSESDNINDLLKEYKLQQQEVYIHDTSASRRNLGRAANKLVDAYEEKYRSDPSYKNEKQMRYWRYSAAEYFLSARGTGEFYSLYYEKELRKKEYLRVLRRKGGLGGLTENEIGALILAGCFIFPFAFAIFLGIMAQAS